VIFKVIFEIGGDPYPAAPIRACPVDAKR